MSENINVLYTRSEIRGRIKELAAEISKNYLKTGKRNIHVVCVLKGAVFFACDLVRELSPEINVIFDVARVSSYGAGTESTGVMKEYQGPTKALTGHDVLVVEDIIDSGNTMSWLLQKFGEAQPASVKICTLLDKPSRRVVANIQPDYYGFKTPDMFVIGYGLDYDEKYRNLPDICALIPE